MSYGTWILIRKVTSIALPCMLWSRPRMYVPTIFYCLVRCVQTINVFFIYYFWCLNFESDRSIPCLQTHKAIKTFMTIRSYGLPANVAIYNIMIECCKLLPCVKSASAVLSLMLRDGFYPTILTFTSLVKVSPVSDATVTFDSFLLVDFDFLGPLTWVSYLLFVMTGCIGKRGFWGGAGSVGCMHNRRNSAWHWDFQYSTLRGIWKGLAMIIHLFPEWCWCLTHFWTFCRVRFMSLNI